MNHVFESIREAYETLYDDSKREFYASNLKAKPAEEKPATPAEQAVAAFKRAEALFKKKDNAGAEAELEAASKLDNKAVYLAVRAWVVYTDRKDAAQAKQMMGEALKVDPKCDRAHYQLGVIARVEGDMDKAEKHFREAVRYNPRHAEANQELRLIDMRKKKSK
jgi:tetratricopeptide (TPR) repeat protein